MSIDTPIVTDTPAVTDTAASCCDDRDKHGAMLMATDPSSILTPGAAATTASVRTKRCSNLRFHAGIKRKTAAACSCECISADSAAACAWAPVLAALP
jgi:hypothetical protein